MMIDSKQLRVSIDRWLDAMQEEGYETTNFIKHIFVRALGDVEVEQRRKNISAASKRESTRLQKSWNKGWNRGWKDGSSTKPKTNPYKPNTQAARAWEKAFELVKRIP